ncbi:hypothetical protein VTK56DRAFT_7318 [Thermocarpiscus australiensis]
MPYYVTSIEFFEVLSDTPTSGILPLLVDRLDPMEHQGSAPTPQEHHDTQSFQQASPYGGWDPSAPSPPIDSQAMPPQGSGGSFSPRNLVHPELNASLSPETPSSAGLGIGGVGHTVHPSGYQYIFPHDPYQTPPQDSSQFIYQPCQTVYQPPGYIDASPEPNAYYSHQYGESPPVGPGTPFEKSGSWRWPEWSWLNSSWPMYTMFCLGIVLAACHHAFYSYLDGRPADDQIGMIRIGGFLSYAAKSSLVSAVVFAYRQQAWVTVRRKILRLRTIDSLFAAVNEPMALLNWEYAKKAKLAMALAVFAWLFPITVIVTPAALTVTPRMEVKEDRCYGVRTLNFDEEKKKNWRNEDRLNGFRGTSLSLWNCTVEDSSHMANTPFNETFFDYWTASSAQVDLVSSQSALSGSVVPRHNVALETCGAGWNCSYTISFKAPGYQCAEVARGRKLDEDALAHQGVPFNAGELAPSGDWGYIAYTNLGDYAPNQIDSGIGGVPKMKPPYPKNLGAFRTEPVLWIGYSIPTGPGRPPENRSVEGWDTAFEASVFRCEHYLTDYTVQFNHTYSSQATTILKREYLRPIINTTYVPDRNADDGTKDNTTAMPESNYVFPLDVDNYRLTAAYHSLGSSMRRFLEGKVKYAPYALVETEATKTPLIDRDTYLPIPNLMEQIQQFYENITLSLLSDPQLVIVTWAAQPDTRSGVGTPATAAAAADPALAYPCTRTRISNAYLYKKRDLWIAYAVAIVAALACVVLGHAALAQNNHRVRDVHVSSIVAATRAPCLEAALPWKSSFASKWGEVPPEVLDAKLGYGVIIAPSDAGPPSGGMTPQAGAGAPSTWASAKVYYGFAPPEVLEQTRAAAAFGRGAKARARGSAISFRIWEGDY